jgi:hypothetical protein
MMGGRRKGGSRRKQRKGGSWKMYGGANEPSFGVDRELGTAGPSWTGVSTAGAVNSATGQPMADPTAPQAGGRRRKSKALANALRELKKGGKRTLKNKGKKTRLTKRMKGGAAQYLPARASAGFSGAGSRGLADYTDVSGSAPRANDVVPLRG